MDGPEFFEQIKDPLVRDKLAVRACGEAFYAGLDSGDNMDVALDRALHLMPTFTRFFEEAVESGTLPEGHTAEDWGTALDEINAGVRSSHEPSNFRKTVAGFLLKQEVRTSNGVIPTSKSRRQEFRARTA